MSIYDGCLATGRCDSASVVCALAAIIYDSSLLFCRCVEVCRCVFPDDVCGFGSRSTWGNEWHEDERGIGCPLCCVERSKTSDKSYGVA